MHMPTLGLTHNNSNAFYSGGPEALNGLVGHFKNQRPMIKKRSIEPLFSTHHLQLAHPAPGSHPGCTNNNNKLFRFWYSSSLRNIKSFWRPHTLHSGPTRTKPRGLKNRPCRLVPRVGRGVGIQQPPRRVGRAVQRREVQRREAVLERTTRAPEEPSGVCQHRNWPPNMAQGFALFGLFRKECHPKGSTILRTLLRNSDSP